MNTNTAAPQKAPVLKHPFDWRDVKKTPHSLYCLGIAVAWHARRCATDAMPFDGPVVDPLGNETEPMTEEQYDSLVEAAKKTLQGAKDYAVTLKPPVAAKHVAILPHDSAHHAVVVRMPFGPDAMAVVNEQRNAADGQEDVVRVYSFSSRMLWPVDGSAERLDLMDGFSLAFHMIYPVEYLKLAGWRGAEVKRRG